MRAVLLAGVVVCGPSLSYAQEDGTGSAAQHVPPEPPEHPMPAMSYPQMVQTMQMDDTASTGKVLLDQFEWRDVGAQPAAVWQGEAWYGGDYDKLWLRTEGSAPPVSPKMRVSSCCGTASSPGGGNLQAGAREDFGNGPSRTWAALGIRGLAPYWFHIEATVYVGDASRTAARLKVEYDLPSLSGSSCSRKPRPTSMARQIRPGSWARDCRVSISACGCATRSAASLPLTSASPGRGCLERRRRMHARWASSRPLSNCSPDYESGFSGMP